MAMGEFTTWTQAGKYEVDLNATGLGSICRKCKMITGISHSTHAGSQWRYRVHAVTSNGNNVGEPINGKNPADVHGQRYAPEVGVGSKFKRLATQLYSTTPTDYTKGGSKV